MHHKANEDKGAYQSQDRHDSRILQVASKAEPQRSCSGERHQNINYPMLAPVENVHHRAYRRFAFVFLFPVFRFRNIFTQPEGEDNWQDADEEQRAPSPDRDHQTVDLGGDHGTNGKAGNQETTGFVSQMFRPAFNNIGCAGTILTGHSHTDNQAGDKHGGVARRKAAGQRPHGEQNDAGDHCQAASVAVAHCPQH